MIHSALEGPSAPTVKLGACNVHTRSTIHAGESRRKENCLLIRGMLEVYSLKVLVPHHSFSDALTPENDQPKKKRNCKSLKDQISMLQKRVDDLCHNGTPNEVDLKSLQDIETSAEAEIPSESLPRISPPANDSLSINSPDMLVSKTSYGIHSRYHLEIFQSTDTFVAKVASPSSIAISSQIHTLQNLETKFKAPRPRPLDESKHKAISVHLPGLLVLWDRVEAFFQEFECFWPFLRQEKVRQRLSVVLKTLSPGKNDNEYLVKAPECTSIAILFNILAYAELMTESYVSVDCSPGTQSYCSGLSLMESFGKLHENTLETVVYHTISASFFLAAEKLHMALQSASEGFYIARCIELNNQKRWPKNLKGDIACRQSLWWTLYFLDKRITQKIGISYSVRENECGVQEFLCSEDDIQPHAHHDMLQSMISFSQLWAYIWDSFFSPRASSKKNDWEELELTDTRIKISYRRLPSSLQWSSEEVFGYLGENNERQIRRRLLVFLVSYLLGIYVFN